MSEPNANQNYGNEYYVDLVMCIDGTGSMRGIIDEVKRTAKNFYALFLEAMNENDPPKQIKDNGFRTKVIVFRDFADSSSTPLESSRFFNLADSRDFEEFNSFVDKIEPYGGGDIPECALEAIATALQSEWEPRGGRFRRQAILLFTDTLTYDFNIPDRIASEKYPSRMPKSVTELGDIWENGNQELAPYYAPKNGRLIVFAPLDTGLANPDPDHRTIEWSDFTSWYRTWIVPVKPNGGCDEVDIKQALAVLVGSF